MKTSFCVWQPVSNGVASTLAAAIVAGAQDRGIEITDVHAFTSLTGKGVTGEVNGHKVMLGNQALFTEFDMELGDLVQRAEALRQEDRR